MEFEHDDDDDVYWLKSVLKKSYEYMMGVPGRHTCMRVDDDDDDPVALT